MLPLVLDEEDAMRMVRDEELLSKVVEVESSLNEDSFKKRDLLMSGLIGTLLGILKGMILSVGVGGGGGYGLSSTTIVADFVIKVYGGRVTAEGEILGEVLGEGHGSDTM
ncbi:hypothetical protein Tco_1508663 [Tanacetum coccineum]